jgi:hypothetical protein
MCDGATFQPALGRHEFDFYLSTDPFLIDSVFVELDWPSSWRAVSWETCECTLIHGDPAMPRTPIYFHLNCAHFTHPFLRLTLDCTTPGRLDLEDAIHECGYPEWRGDVYYRYVDIALPCGSAHLSDPCTDCFYGLAGRFTPESLQVDLPSGGMYSDTILVRGDSDPEMWCGGNPACGSSTGFPWPCLTGVSADVDWMTVVPVDEIDHWLHSYRLVVDTEGLAVGEYSGRLVAHRGCEYECVDNCMMVDLTVGLVPVKTQSWSAVKGGFRR